METTQERKERYIKDILAAHPVWIPETFIAQKAASAMRRMSEQNLFYLWHLATAKVSYKES